jgi:hypothetical protein
MTTPDPTPAPEPDRELELSWVRDVPDGLRAYAPLPPGGRYDRDRHNRPRFTRVRLRAADNPPAPDRPDGLLSDSDWAWITSSARAWASVTGRFGDHATAITTALARAGCVTIEHDLAVTALRQPPRRLHPHPELAAAHATRRTQRHDDSAALRTRATALAAALSDDWPGVAAALRRTDHPDRLAWAVHAAADLADGVTHDSVRAFVQAHAAHTKARDSVHHLLADLGFEPDAVTALGLGRSPYIGLGGPILLHTRQQVIDLGTLPGPHDIRLSPNRPCQLRLPAGTPALAIIENRQAAETVCDTRPDLPVIWCHGQPPDAVLDLIDQAAHQTRSVLIYPDADLGGVRIAARIHDRLHPHTGCRVIDIGTSAHSPGRPFNQHSRTRLAALAARDDQIGAFAAQCLARGYAIEQEATARASLRETLT